MARRRFSSEPDRDPVEPDRNPVVAAALSPRLPVSPEPRVLCLLLLDVSGSMAASGALEAVLAALPEFRASILKHPLTIRKLSFAVVAFADGPEVLRGYGPVTEWEPPTELGGGNGTAMGTAILKSLRLEEEHVEALASQGISVQHSMCFLVTDGYPNSESPERFEEAMRLIARKESKNRFAFYSIAVEGADIETLRRLTPKRTPLRLAEVNDLHKFMAWVGKSIVIGTMTQPGMRVQLPNPMKTKPKKGDEGEDSHDENPLGWAELP
jgi:uncharacterized protein YegL